MNSIQNKNFQRRESCNSNQPIELAWKYHLIKPIDNQIRLNNAELGLKFDELISNFSFFRVENLNIWLLKKSKV